MSKIDELNEFLGRSPFHQWLNCKIVDYVPESGTIALVFEGRDELHRSPNANVSHGGALAAFVDIAAHAVLQAETGRGMPTIDLRIDYLRPAEFPITARAKRQRLGKNVGVADVEIISKNGECSALGRAVFLTRNASAGKFG